MPRCPIRYHVKTQGLKTPIKLGLEENKALPPRLLSVVKPEFRSRFFIFMCFYTSAHIEFIII